MLHEENNPLLSLQQEMTRLFDRFFGREVPSFYPMEGWHSPFPQVDVKDTEKTIKVAVELPGMSDKDIHVSITGNSLAIKGERKEEKGEKEGSYVRMERHYGSFNRVIFLPEEVNPNKAEAHFRNGLLEIELPKSEKAISPKKRIDIKSEMH
jgi:HSP20 family protein